jgi:hypothetical protein
MAGEISRRLRRKFIVRFYDRSIGHNRYSTYSSYETAKSKAIERANEGFIKIAIYNRTR